MDTLMYIDSSHIGWLVWLLWALIGIFGAFVSQRYMTGKGVFGFNCIIGVVAALLGGYLSTQFLGDSPVQIFLISVLGAVFFTGAALWITVAIWSHFAKRQ